MKEVKEEFEKIIKVPLNVEKEAQDIEDNQKANDIVYGEQTVEVATFGKLTFRYPELGVALEGDRIYAKFKAEHLRKGDLLTKAQLAAMYKQPITIKVDGQETIIEDGEWTEADETKMDSYIPLIEEAQEMFSNFREEIEHVENEIISIEKIPGKQKRVKHLVTKKGKLVDEAYKKFEEIYKLRLEMLDLQTKKEALFSISLEEQAQFEKLKIYIPYCILVEKDNKKVPLWNNVEEMNKAGLDGARILSMLSLFMKGTDLSFFGVGVENKTP